MINLLGIPSEYNDAVIGGVIFVGVLVDQILAGRRGRKVVVPAAAEGTSGLPSAAGKPL
jgi:hypothetical protein